MEECLILKGIIVFIAHGVTVFANLYADMIGQTGGTTRTWQNACRTTFAATGKRAASR